MSQELRLIRRITLKLIPFLILLYLIAYVDRSAVGFAKLHMGADIGIGDAAYGLGAGLFFIGYFLLEIPSNLMLDRFGARRWFARIMLTWGAITIGMAFVQGPYSFYLMRLLLGLHGWQWLLIAIGTPAILLTWPVLRYLPDGPRQVAWMDQAERPAAVTGGAVPGGVRAVFLYRGVLDLAGAFFCRRQCGDRDCVDQPGGQPGRLHRSVRDRQSGEASCV